jgi:metallo-beta-lactamase class B
MAMRPLLVTLVIGVTTVAAQRTGVLQPDPPMQCDACEQWNRPREPFRLFGNTYFVGTRGLSAILITSDAGHILLDGGLSQSAPLIDQNIRQLKFRTEDIRLIVNSHAHYDHAGGIAAIQRLSGAAVAASPSGARALAQGEPTTDDPQYAFGRAANAYPAAANVRAVGDGETLRVGSIGVTAHFTPGHTPGSTTWTWQACEGARCLNLVYADSLNPVAAPGFRFTGDAKTPSRIESFRASIARIESLRCDVIVTVHPELSGLDQKLARRASETQGDPMIDPQGCRVYAGNARRRLEQRIAQEP